MVFLLFEDYLLYYIFKNFNEQKKELIASIKDFIKILLNIKFNFEDNTIDLLNLATRINWIQSYSMEIVTIIKTYIFLNSFEKGEDLNKKIKIKIQELGVLYNNNIDINNNIKIINRPFYNIIGALINILISNLSQILSEIKNQEKLNELLDKLNNIYYSLLLNNNALNLSSKEIHLLHETIKIISILSFNDKIQEMEQKKQLLINFIQKKIISEKKEKIELKTKNEGPKLKIDNNNKGEAETEDTEEEKNLKIF